VTIPTQDTDGRKLEWTVFSFGSRASASERSAASLSPYSVEALNEQDGTAIRVGDGDQAVLLVRHPQHGKGFSIKEKDGEVMTPVWNEDYDENPTSFFRIVREVLAAGERISGK
jgi:hypothetical protein